jgi:hypothetical protein
MCVRRDIPNVLLETLLRDCGAYKESKEQADPHECSLETPAVYGNNETDSFSPLQTPLCQLETGSSVFSAVLHQSLPIFGKTR